MVVPFSTAPLSLFSPSGARPGGWANSAGWVDDDVSYGHGAWANCNDQEPWPKVGYALAQLKYAAQSISVGDSAHRADLSRWEKLAYANMCCADDANPGRRIDDNTRHNGGGNAACIDGHAKCFAAGAVQSSWGNMRRSGP